MLILRQRPSEVGVHGEITEIAVKLNVGQPSEKEREINSSIIRSYLPDRNPQLPALIKKKGQDSDFGSEREILYKVLFDMKGDLNDLKKLTLDLIKNGKNSDFDEKNQGLIEKIYGEKSSIDNKENSFSSVSLKSESSEIKDVKPLVDKYSYAETIEEEEPLSLHEKELEMIKQALIRSKGKRKLAAEELGISERTLYRKINFSSTLIYVCYHCINFFSFGKSAWFLFFFLSRKVRFFYKA